MDTAQKLMTSIASLMWPLIVIAVLIRFRPAIAAIVESAKSRKFTLKIGGQELTMEEANQVQQNLIADLQSQVAEIKKSLDLMPAVAAVAQTEIPPAATVHRVLWVDDYPKNNSYFIEQLSKVGVAVDLALSTADGLKLLDSRKYDYVISDMGRREGLFYSSKAGIDLLTAVRQKQANLPFIIFCSGEAVDKYGQEALELGATAITSSSTELAGILAAQSG